MLLDFSDRTRTGMFNVIWPLASSRENFKLHMILGNVNIYFAIKCIFIKRYLCSFYYVSIATYHELIRIKKNDKKLILQPLKIDIVKDLDNTHLERQ